MGLGDEEVVVVVSIYIFFSGVDDGDCGGDDGIIVLDNSVRQ